MKKEAPNGTANILQHDEGHSRYHNSSDGALEWHVYEEER